MTDQDMSAMPANGAADEAAMRDWAELLVARARAEGVELTGDGGLLTGLVRQVLQCGLEVEMAVWVPKTVMLLCLSTRELGEVPLVAFGEVAVVVEAPFEC